MNPPGIPNLLRKLQVTLPEDWREQLIGPTVQVNFLIGLYNLIRECFWEVLNT